MATTVRRMKLGSQGLEVSAQGLGCMGMSAFYGPPKPEADMISLIRYAIDNGITFFDSADVYGPFINEILIGKAVKGELREKVQLATKFGIRFGGDGKMEIKGDPAYVRAACEASLKHLDVHCIDLYYIHRIDTSIPIEITMHELKKLVEEGKIKYVGLSEASASTIRRAHSVHPITAVQLEWSLWARDAEQEVIPACRELGIGVVAYSPLGQGFLSSGPKMVENLSKDDFRKILPKFQPENLQHNGNMFDRVHKMAKRKGCTPSQLALAWVHHQGNDVCPIPGTTKIENLKQNIGALSVKLTEEEMAELELIASVDAVKGDRYGGVISTWKESYTPPLSSWKPQLFLCVCIGLWAGLIIGFVTEYYTSNAYSPVQDVADSCRTGAATNVVSGVTLGYKSITIPIFAIAISIFVNFSFAAMYGIAVAAQHHRH